MNWIDTYSISTHQIWSSTMALVKTLGLLGRNIVTKFYVFMGICTIINIMLLLRLVFLKAEIDKKFE